MNFIKIIGGLIGAIFIGAIGSGLWERFLSPAVDSSYRFIVSLFSNLYSGYLDSIYVEASKNLPDIYQKKIAFLILTIFSGYLVFVSLKYGGWQSPFFKRIGVRLNRVLPFNGLLMGFSIFIISYFALAKFDYVQEIKSYSQHSLEILRPYIGENEYLMLKSEYYQIGSSKDFFIFNDNIIEQANKHEVNLLEIDLIK
jgi:hypothetical protein